jgi:hypothetical protein
MLKLVHDTSARAEQAPTTVGLDELCRLAARQMLATALLAERQAYLDAHAELVDEVGKRLVVGNGYAKEREVTMRNPAESGHLFRTIPDTAPAQSGQASG